MVRKHDAFAKLDPILKARVRHICELNRGDVDEIKKHYLESIQKRRFIKLKFFWDVLILGCVLVLIFNHFLEHLGRLNGVGLLLLVYAIHKIGWRNGHVHGYCEGYVLGHDRGINDALGIGDKENEEILDIESWPE